mgnify:CR=1 FL=1
MNELKYFTYEEFDCPYTQTHSSGFRHMDREFLHTLDRARHLAELKFKILKGYISPSYAHRCNELSNSSHLIGRAAVIQCKNIYKRYRIITALLEAGFTRIGIHHKYLYVDNDDLKTDAIFHYQMNETLEKRFIYL